MVIVSRKNLYSRQQRIPNFSRKREKKISRDINKNILRLDKKKNTKELYVTIRLINFPLILQD